MQTCTECKKVLYLLLVSTKPSLRQAKRLATYRAILDSATKQLVAKGYCQVTIDDICEDAGISKRTFFNYVDSKDAAILGHLPASPSEEAKAAFCATRHDRLIEAAMEFTFKEVFHEFKLTFEGAELEPEFTRMLAERRKQVNDPHLRQIIMRTIFTATADIKELLDEYFATYPDARVLNTDEESRVTTLAIIGVIQLGMRNWMFKPETHVEDIWASCLTALADTRAVLQVNRPQTQTK